MLRISQDRSSKHSWHICNLTNNGRSVGPLMDKESAKDKVYWSDVGTNTIEIIGPIFLH
jgi:hypothetical protein